MLENEIDRDQIYTQKRSAEKWNYEGEKICRITEWNEKDTPNKNYEVKENMVSNAKETPID